MADKHEVENIDKIEHKKTGSFENGQCLSPHQFPFEERNSCSYRWQGIKKGKENKHIYHAHRGFGGRPAKEYRFGEYNNVSYSSVSSAGKTIGNVLRRFKTTSDDGEEKSMVEIKAQNFTNGKLPYPNQVHHVLPCAELRDGLDSVVNDARMIEHVCNSLLKEKYNLNHHLNMLILPKTPGHAKEIGLPMHPNNHSGYSDQLGSMIKNALASAEQARDEAEEENHDNLDYLQIKKNFEKISKTMYRVLAKPGVMPRHTIYGEAIDIKDWDQFPEINFG